jgi:hypothetical protein
MAAKTKSSEKTWRPHWETLKITKKDKVTEFPDDPFALAIKILQCLDVSNETLKKLIIEVKTKHTIDIENIRKLIAESETGGIPVAPGLEDMMHLLTD